MPLASRRTTTHGRDARATGRHGLRAPAFARIARIRGILSRMPTLRRLILPALIFLSCPLARGGDDWPQFRGPTGLGYTAERDLPLKWDGKTGENILWKADLPGEGHASPI